VDFVQIDALFAAIAFSDEQTLIHVAFYLSVKKISPVYTQLALCE